MRRFVASAGRVFITAGILILGFVVYQLWGTGIYEAKAQHELTNQFKQELKHQHSTSAPTIPDASPAPAPVLLPPVPGAALGIISIPKIGLEKAIVEGIAVGDLRRGPGHYPETPQPGQLGNAAIAGHRTTYGAPFNRLDELGVGDDIRVETLAGTFHYKVRVQADGSAHQVVSPRTVSVVATDNPNVASLTLTTCNPKYSAATRLIVQADLVTDASPVPQPPTKVPDSEKATAAFDSAVGLSGSSSEWPATILWSLLLAALGALWWFLFSRVRGKGHWIRIVVWFAGALPFAIVLFFTYSHIERLLPAGI